MTRGKVVVQNAIPNTDANGRRPRRYAASVFGGGAIGEPPDRVRLWRAGPNPWDRGVVNFTPAAAAAVIGAYERRGNPLSMDFEHAISIAEAAGKSAAELPTAGYCALELAETPDGPEIYFLPRWSNCGSDAPVPGVVCCAYHQIKSGQRCEFSPDWDADATTGEPLRVNRISLVLDGATHKIGLLASRAAAERRAVMDPVAQARAAYAYHAKMAAAGGEDAKEHEAQCAKMKASAASLGFDIEKDGEGEPAPKPEAERPAQAAEGQGEPRPEPPREQPQAARSVASAAAAAPKPITMADVLAHLGERDELRALLADNKDRLAEPTARLLAGRGLAFAREFIATLPARPAPSGSGGDAGGAVTQVKAWQRPLTTPEERFMATRIDAALGMTGEIAAAFEKRVDDDGGTTISLVKIVKEQRDARLASRRVA